MCTALIFSSDINEYVPQKFVIFSLITSIPVSSEPLMCKYSYGLTSILLSVVLPEPGEPVNSMLVTKPFSSSSLTLFGKIHAFNVLGLNFSVNNLLFEIIIFNFIIGFLLSIIQNEMKFCSKFNIIIIDMLP